MKMVASTCPEQFSGQLLFSEPSESGLPAGLLASPCLGQIVQPTSQWSTLEPLKSSTHEPVLVF